MDGNKTAIVLCVDAIATICIHVQSVRHNDLHMRICVLSCKKDYNHLPACIFLFEVLFVIYCLPSTLTLALLFSNEELLQKHPFF